MKQKTTDFIAAFFRENQSLLEMKDNICRAIDMILCAYQNGNKVLICGNGGSASDSEHIVGELMKGFLLKRLVPNADRETMIASCGDTTANYICDRLQGALPAISLVSHTALQTAFCNDVDPQMVFAQQVYGYKKDGDVLIGLSTSGNSKNVFYAMCVANAFRMTTIALTGCKDSKLSEISTVTIRSPQMETYRVQEDHLKIYHLLCGAVELELFDN